MFEGIHGSLMYVVRSVVMSFCVDLQNSQQKLTARQPLPTKTEHVFKHPKLQTCPPLPPLLLLLRLQSQYPF
jgi:hypothetical protein